MRNLKDCQVLVTPTSYANHDPRLRAKLEAEVGEVVYNTMGKPLSPPELQELIPGCDALIAGLDTIDRAVIETADRLKVIVPGKRSLARSSIGRFRKAAPRRG